MSRRRRRNGKSSGMPPFSEIAGVTVGVLGTSLIPSLLLGANNVGTTNLIAEGATAAALAFLGRKIGMGSGDLLAGGISAIAAKFAAQTLTPSLASSAGLSYYINNGFPLPTTGRGPYLLNDSSDASPTANGDMTPQVTILPPAPPKSSFPGWLPWAAAAAAALMMVKD